MRPRQRMDAAFQRADKFLDRTRTIARLRQQAADQRKDVADAMVQLRDQQFLLLVRALPFLVRRVGEAQHDFEQGRAQRFGYAQFGGGKGQRYALDQLRPAFEALARGQAWAVGAIFDMLVLLPGPAHRAQLFGPEQHDIVARTARERNRQQPGGAIGIVGSPR